MDNELLQVMGLIREEIELYRTLVGYLDKRTDLLVENDIKSLARNTEASEALILKIKSLEDGLRMALKAIARRLDAPAETLTLSALAEKVVHPLAHSVADHSATLQDLIVQTERLSRRNAVLFTHTLDYLQALGGLVLGTVSSYQSSGALQPFSLRTSSLSHEA